MMYRFSPKRSELFGKDADLEENIKALEDFIGPLQANIRQVHDFYTLHDLHCLKKVWSDYLWERDGGSDHAAPREIIPHDLEFKSSVLVSERSSLRLYVG